MPKYGVISGTYFPVFSPNTGKYGPEITPYLDTFHVVSNHQIIISTHHPVAESIVKYYHEQYLHVGREQILPFIRSIFVQKRHILAEVNTINNNNNNNNDNDNNSNNNESLKVNVITHY